jgi:hypothetical protein
MTKWTMVYDDYDVRQVMVILQKLSFVGGPSFNEHSYQVWFQLAPWFQTEKRSVKVKVIDDTTDDDRRQVKVS